MDFVERLGGVIISVTTDGFLTNIEDLEAKVIAKMEESVGEYAGVRELKIKELMAAEKRLKALTNGGAGGSAEGIKMSKKVRDLSKYREGGGDHTPCYLFLEFVKVRRFLTGNPNACALDVKESNPGVGVISWGTRGQLGLNSSLKAATGYQVKVTVTAAELLDKIASGFSSPGKEIGYVQSSLRSGIDVYKRGGHVTSVYRDQVFRLQYDNRRRLSVPENHPTKEILVGGEVVKILDMNDSILLSEPLKDRDDCKILRFISKQAKGGGNYSASTTRSKGTVYKKLIDLGVRQFIRGVYGGTLGIDRGDFPLYKDFLS